MKEYKMLKAVETNGTSSIVLAWSYGNIPYDRKEAIKEFVENVANSNEFHFIEGVYDVDVNTNIIYFNMEEFPFPYQVMGFNGEEFYFITEESNINDAVKALTPQESIKEILRW